MHDDKEPPRNVLGGKLARCVEPSELIADGFCGEACEGRGVICAVMTRRFLEFAKARGTDLMRPSNDRRFPGLKPGMAWCIPADLFREAELSGQPPLVRLLSTPISVLDEVPLDTLKLYAFESEGE